MENELLEQNAAKVRLGLPHGQYVCQVKARIKSSPELESDVIGTVGESRVQSLPVHLHAVLPCLAICLLSFCKREEDAYLT